MKHTVSFLIILSIIVGQLLLTTGLAAFSAPAAAAAPLSLPPTARPSLTPTLAPTNTPAATNTPVATNTPGRKPTATSAAATLTPTNTPLPPTATILQKAVNVRSGPGLIYDILGVARQDERYLVTGQFPPGDWLQIDFRGRPGWIFRGLVTLNVDLAQIPTITEIPPTPTFTPSPIPTETPTSAPSPTAAAGATTTPASPTPTPEPPMAIIVGQQVPIRQGPGLIYDIIGSADQGQQFPITGLAPSGDWFQIDYQGQPGWVFLVQVEPVANLAQIPVVTQLPPTPTPTPEPPMAIIVSQQAPIRQGPGLIYDVIGSADQGQQFPITGLAPSGDWLQIDYQGQPGWVFLMQVEPVANLAQIPVITQLPPTPTPTPDAVTPPPATTATPVPAETPSSGPPTLALIIGGLLALILAALVIFFGFIRRRNPGEQ